MASLGDLFGGIGLSFGGGFISSIASIFIGIISLGVVIFVVYFILKRRKHWNLKIEFKIPRDVKEEKDGSIKGNLTKEWGKGYYDAKRGAVYVKRKGKRPVPMKPFDIKRYLSSTGILTVIQIGVEDYRPVLDESYIEVVEEKTGEEGALLRATVDTSESLSWRRQFEREAKDTYSIMSFLQQHGEKLVYALIIMIILVGQAIVISRLS